MRKIIILLIMATTVFLSAVNGTYSKEEKKIAAKGFVGYNIPFGDFSDIWGSGIGLYGVFEYKVTPDFGIGLHIGYQFWEPIAESQDVELLFTDIPILLEFIYYFEKAKGFQPYAGIEAGLHIIAYRQENRSTNYKENIDDNNIGFAPFVGLIIPFGGGTFVDINIKYTTILKSDKTPNALRANKVDIQNLSHVGINAGVSFPF